MADREAKPGKGWEMAATVSDFLVALTDELSDLWHRDREAAMTSFGLDETQKTSIRRALETNDLSEVERIVNGEAKPSTVYKWVK
jgi:hypothetical protein